MNIQPLADRVLVLPAVAEEKIGGIIIPDTAKEKPLRGKIVATGKGTKDEEMIPKKPMIAKKRAMPTTVANTFLKKSFIAIIIV